MTPRLYITTADIQLLTGKNQRQSQYFLQTVRDSLKKKKHQQVSFREYCDDTSTNYNDLLLVIPDAALPKTPTNAKSEKKTK